MSVGRILVVESDAAQLNTMSQVLRRQGYHVEQAGDAYNAMDILAAQPAFAALVAPLKLDGDAGQDLLQAARKMDENLNIILLTAAEDHEAAAAIVQAGLAYDYLISPGETRTRLSALVKRAVAQRQLALERGDLLARTQHQARLLRIITTNSSDAILCANAAGVLQMTNPAAAHLLGSENIEGSLAQSCIPAALSTLIATWQAVGESQPAVIEIPWPDGAIQMVSLNPVYDLNGESQGWVAILRDITHLKRLEDLKNRLLSEAAAKIHAPLAQAMNTLVELNILTSRNERVSQVVYRLMQIWKRIQEWGDDLNTLIRIDARPNIERTNIDLQPVFDELVHSQCEPVSRLTGLHFDFQIDPNLPEIIADPELLRKLLYGLVNRAVGRSQSGCSIRLQARSHDSHVWISVSDDGPAVSDSELPHLFERAFIQTGPNGKTGLEMALVKTITERMDGQVWVGGQDKKGSTIFVCLPAQLQRSLC